MEETGLKPKCQKVQREKEVSKAEMKDAKLNLLHSVD
jgi:hypothetical protein